MMAMDIRLVAFDLDGTVIPMMRREISPVFLASMAKAAARGVTFAVFTGRSVTTVPKTVLDCPDVSYICHSNGGGIVEQKSGRVIYSSPMPNRLALEVLAVLEPMDELVVQIFSKGQVVYTQKALDNLDNINLPSHHLAAVKEGHALGVPSLVEFAQDPNNQVDKLNIARVEDEVRRQVIAALGQLHGLDIVSSGGVNLEFNAHTTNKGLALDFLRQHLGLATEQVMAIGDNDNDVGMLRCAGIGVAIAGGSQAALSAADYVTLSLEEEGAAHAIEKFIALQ